MAKYYRVNLAESLNDGESWSVNNWYEQPYIVEVNDNSDCRSIIKALKVGGLLKAGLQYDTFLIDWSYDEGEIYIEKWYADNSEPLIMKLSLIDADDLDRQLNAHYGIRREPTVLCKA